MRHRVAPAEPGHRFRFRLDAALTCSVKPPQTSHDFDTLLAAVTARGVTAVSHHSAAYVHGLVDGPPPLVHVVSQRGQHPAKRRDVIVHHTRSIDPVELAVVDRDGVLHPFGSDGAERGVTITSLPATVVMLAPYVSVPTLTTVVSRAARRLDGFDALEAAAVQRRRRGRSGPMRVLRTLDALTTRTDDRQAVASRSPVAL